MQDLERALQQIVEGVVQKLGALLSGESGSEQHAKMNKLNRFLDKLSDIQAKIKSMKCAADQPLPDQVLPFALGLVIPGFFHHGFCLSLALFRAHRNVCSNGRGQTHASKGALQ